MDEEKSPERIVKCPSCGTEMRNNGSHTIRMGMSEVSASFGVSSVPVGIAVPFVIYICQSCGKVEFYVEEETEDMIQKTRETGWTPKSFLKKCVQCTKEIPIASEECRYCGARQSKKK